MKLFVTGGAGFIGSNFIHLVLAERPECRIVNFDKLTYAGNLGNVAAVASHPRYRFVKGDISDGPAVLAALQECDAVVHFAAESHVDRSIYEPAPAIQTNIVGTFALLQAARESKVERFVHVSTDEVYGDLPPGAFADEHFLLKPSSPYAASKAGSDLLVQSFVKTYGFPAIITRSSNNYGRYQFPEKFLPLMITNALAGKSLPIYGDGGQQRNWLHVEDNCRAILGVLERGRSGEVYNIGGTDVENNLSMVRRVLHLLQKPESLLAHVTDRPGHDRRYALNCSKITAEIGWRPRIPLADGLQQTVRWYCENTGWVSAVLDGQYRSYYEKYYENRNASLRAVAEARSE
jgi:dTDP-glucose 4,6-dehydratase